VILNVQTLLSQKPKAAIILRMDAKARHENLVRLRDEFDEIGLSSKIEIIRIEAD